MGRKIFLCSICFYLQAIFLFLISPSVGQNTTSSPPKQASATAPTAGDLVSEIVPLSTIANEIIEKKVAEMEKAIDKATEKLQTMNQTLQNIYEYKASLLLKEEIFIKTETAVSLTELKKVRRLTHEMKDYEEEIEAIYNRLLALETLDRNRERKLEDIANYDEKLHQLLEFKQYSFFAQRTSSWFKKDILNNYEINNLNQGEAFNTTLGIFTVPVNGVYFFYFSALKTKVGLCGTSQLSIQLVQISSTSLVLAEIQVDSKDWFGYFPVQLQALVNLVVNDQIGVRLSEGCIHTDGSLQHLTTNFGGFLIASL